MSLPYDEQLKVWAAIRYQEILDEIDTVTMTQEYDEGFSCCGGRDPGCYCSLATGASLILTVTITKTNGHVRTEYIDMLTDDIGPLVKEIIEAHFP